MNILYLLNPHTISSSYYPLHRASNAEVIEIMYKYIFIIFNICVYYTKYIHRNNVPPIVHLIGGQYGHLNVLIKITII